MKKILSIILIAIILCGCFTGCNKKLNNDITNSTIKYNGKTLHMPFTVQDLIDIGLQYEDEQIADKIIEKGASHYPGIYLTSQEGERIIYLYAYNLTESSTELKNCYVTAMETKSSKMSINGVTVNKTKYKDIVKTFGKTTATQKDTFEEEVKNNGAMAYPYMVFPDNKTFVNKRVYSCSFVMYFDKNQDDTVKTLTFDCFMKTH